IGYHYDPSKSKRLLADAGFPEGRDLPELVLSTTSTYLDLSEFIKSQWEELGIKVRIDVNQAAVNRKLVSEQKLSFFRGSWIADYPDAENYLSLFYSPNAAPTGPNYTHYSQSYFDSLYRSALIAESDSARYRLYVDMDRAVMEQAPVIVLYYDKVVRMVRPEVEGLVPNAMNLLWLKYVEKK
ncbi:MAG: ABC transporter substrate-binding protein, partial [Bacteroidota bacterium]